MRVISTFNIRLIKNLFLLHTEFRTLITNLRTQRNRHLKNSNHLFLYCSHTAQCNLCTFFLQDQPNKIRPCVSGSSSLPKLLRSYSSHRITAGDWNTVSRSHVVYSWGNWKSDKPGNDSPYFTPLRKPHDILWETTKHAALVVDEVRKNFGDSLSLIFWHRIFTFKF
jgi:hypothetical protein